MIILITLCFYLVTGLLSTWLDPRQNEADANRKIILLSAKVDSLSAEVSRKDGFITSLKDIISGSGKTVSPSGKGLTINKDKMPVLREITDSSNVRVYSNH